MQHTGQVIQKLINQVQLKNACVDGKQIAYSSETEFLIQIGKGRGSYQTKHSVRGDIGRALMFYNGYNIGNGYKKRLLVPSFNKPILARYISQ